METVYTSDISWIFGIIIFSLLLSLVGIASSVFLGLCVYSDARFKNVKNPAMWGLLSGFLGWIPAIIYLVIRSQQSPKPCQRCFDLLPPGAVFCNICGTPVYQPGPEELAVFDKRRKRFLILWIASYVLTIVAVFFFIGFIFYWVNDMVNTGNYYN